MSFWLSLSSAMPHTSFAGECPSWSAFFGRYEGFSTRCAWRQTPHPVRDATANFGEFPFHALCARARWVASCSWCRPVGENAGLQGGGHSYVVGEREHGLGSPLLRGTRQGGLGRAGTHDGPRLRRSHPDSQPTA